MPHWILRDYKSLCLLAAAASLLLSLLTIYLDPVINRDGIFYIEAARRFAAGNWAEAFSVYKWPFYPFVIGAFTRLTGLSAGAATYVVNSLLYVVLVVGFVAFVRSVGGKGAVLWIAALVVLFYPVINKFRPFVIRDVGYWGFYLWSLACFFCYVQSGRRGLLGAWALLMVVASLFRIEGLAVLLMLPVWLLAVSTGPRHAGMVKIAALVLGLLILSSFTLWQYVSESGTAAHDLLSSPLAHLVDSWGAAGAELGARLQGLAREFGNRLSLWVSVPVYSATLAVLMVVECIEALGVLYAALVAYVLLRAGTGFERPVLYWWTVVVCLQLLLLIAFGALNFFLTERYPIGLALTLLAPVPFLLERLWRRWRARSRPVEWAPLIVGLLLLVSSVEGLDVKTQKQYLKDAGLWLRQQGAVKEQSLYSNSIILLHYAGMPQTDSQHSWNQAMRLVWTGDWRRYDRLALMIEEPGARHEKLILEQIGQSPEATFSNVDGDKVMIFSSGEDRS